MRTLEITFVKLRISELTCGIFGREDRQLLMAGTVAMVSMLLVGVLLAWLDLLQPREVKRISFNSVIRDEGDALIVFESADPAPELPPAAMPLASQLEVLSDKSLKQGDSPGIDIQLATLSLVGSQPADGGGARNREPVTGITDPFNPAAVGLARAGMFRGRTMLAWTNEPYVISQIFPEDQALWRSLRLLGFDVQLRTGLFKPEFLEGVSQVWIFAGRRSGMSDADYDDVVRFVHDGGGLYLCGDNVPYLAESERLCSMLFDCEPRGNYFGEKLLGVYDKFGDKQRLQGPQGKVYIGPKNWQRRHALLTGIQCIFEGHTISTLPHSVRLTPVLRASNQRTLAAVSKQGLRVVVDGGFTRYDPAYNLSGTEKGAGTLLWATNIAAYLEGDERTGVDDRNRVTLTGS